MSITVNAKFGFDNETGEILLSCISLNMIFSWVSRSINMNECIHSLLYKSDLCNNFTDIEKQKIIIINKLLLAITAEDYINCNITFPSKDANIMANAISLILNITKLSIKNIKEDFYGFMEYLERQVASGERTEQHYKTRLDNCKFIGDFIENIELIDFDNKIFGRWTNDEDDGEQCLVIKYKDSPCCCSCNCHNTDSSSDEEEEEEGNKCVYVIKTYEFNHKEQTIDYAGLWENCDGETEFKTEAEAILQFEYASDGTRGYIAVELVEIDPTKNENRETTIDEWEDNIEDYIASESSDEEEEE